MPSPPEDSVHPKDRMTWRRWLEKNHTESRGVWLVTWRKASGRTPLSYDGSVEEALCFGWVDSLGRKLDDDRTMLRFTPRKPGSLEAAFDQRAGAPGAVRRLPPLGAARHPRVDRHGQAPGDQGAPGPRDGHPRAAGGTCPIASRP